MKSSLMDIQLDSNSYDEYIDKVINIFRLSSPQSSILFDLTIENYQAVIDLSIVNLEGERQEFHDVVMKCDESFYHSFLLTFLKRMDSLEIIETKDIVNSTFKSLKTFRMITKNNDLITVDGLSMDDATSLMKLSSDKKATSVLPIQNDRGSSNPKFLFFMIGVLVIIFILIVTIVD